MSYEALQEAITQWAAAEPGVRAVALIGSRARTDHPADDWSDLDLILFVNEPQRFVDNHSWLNTFGELWLRVLNFTGVGDPEWLVLFAGGFKVDLILAPASQGLSEGLSNSFYARAAARGVRMLLDKGGAGYPQEIPAGAAGRRWDQPSFEEFGALLQQFWLSCYRASTMLRRGELWRAKSIVDGQMREQNLLMLEWHAKARMGEAYETWYQGRFLQEWVEPQLLRELAGIFAPFDRDATRQAIIASTSLMNHLGRETAGYWGYPYPIANQNQVQDWITAALKGLK